MANKAAKNQLAKKAARAGGEEGRAHISGESRAREENRPQVGREQEAARSPLQGDEPNGESAQIDSSLLEDVGGFVDDPQKWFRTSKELSAHAYPLVPDLVSGLPLITSRSCSG